VVIGAGHHSRWPVTSHEVPCFSDDLVAKTAFSARNSRVFVPVRIENQ
jgi:hypothetical protein